jgi:DNA-binding transcriptional MerR regulator
MTPLPDVQFGSLEPLYNIGVVARMTGVSMATLRAWERRYEFPESERTAGGHRLYSEKDVVRLRWVKARIDEGMQTAQAIHALRHQEQAGHIAVHEASQVGGTELPPASYPSLMGAAGGGHLDVFRDRLFEALIHRDIQTADTILSDALSVSTPDDLILDMLAPTLSQIGDAWESGLVTVATEHLATNYLRQRLLMWMLSGPPPKAVEPIVLACAPNEWHEGGLLVIGSLLRRRRWPVAYLGQSVPLMDLAGFIRDLKPRVAIVIAMTEATATELSEWPKWLPESGQSGRPIIGYAGRIFSLQPGWRMRMQGVFLGNSFREGLDTIEKLLEG